MTDLIKGYDGIAKRNAVDGSRRGVPKTTIPAPGSRWFEMPDASVVILTRCVHDQHIAELQPFVDASKREGLLFLHRLIDEWNSASNRFDRPGEVLLAAHHGGAEMPVIAVGGLNIDPYENAPGSSCIARVRHVYVDPEHRRRGVGRILVERLMERARRHGFNVAQLRTAKPAASAFYEAIGFQRIAASAHATHRVHL